MELVVLSDSTYLGYCIGAYQSRNHSEKGQYAYSPQVFYEVAQKKTGQPYYDVTRGDNLYYHATPGWTMRLVGARLIWLISIMRSFR